MIQDAFNIGGRTIAWNPEKGTYESNTFDPTLIGGETIDIETDINKTIMPIPTLETSKETQEAASKPARSEEDKTYASNFEIEEREKDEPGYEKRQSSAVYSGTATTKDSAGTTAISRSAQGMSEDDDRRSTEQAGMAGQDTTSLAAGKFGGNKGGLAKKRKRTTKKK